jgi:hypothetical protein
MEQDVDDGSQGSAWPWVALGGGSDVFASPAAPQAQRSPPCTCAKPALLMEGVGRLGTRV